MDFETDVSEIVGGCHISAHLFPNAAGGMKRRVEVFESARMCPRERIRFVWILLRWSCYSVYFHNALNAAILINT